MDYKAYYDFKTTADGDKDVFEINFDYVNLGHIRFDVHDADGFGWEGKNVNCSGSFNFTCEEYDEDEEDYIESDLDWENIDDLLEDLEATFSLFDDEYEPINYGEEDGDECEFELLIYDNDGKPHKGKTGGVYPGNM